MSYHWSIHQVTEYFVAVSGPFSAEEAIQVALERATEALEGELGVVCREGAVLRSAGFGRRTVPPAFLDAQDGDVLDLPGLGETHLAVGRLDTPDGRVGTPGARLVVGRLGDPYSAEERQMLQGMALVLGLRLQSLATLTVERARHRLVENLLQIQRAISARRPLTEVLDAVTSGASSLLGDAPVALFLTDGVGSDGLRPVSVHNLTQVDDVFLDAARCTLSGGDATDAETCGVLTERVVVSGETVGVLVCAGTRDDAVAGQHSGELLSAFATQVNLALTDARTLDAVREAHRDPVTSLPNRALLLERLDAARAQALAEGRPLTVLFIDLDRFKAVNDTLGHRAGDALLADVAHRLLTCIGGDDVAGRIGGDEFAVVLPAAVDVGERVAERIIAALTRTFTIEGREVSIGASVGVAPLRGADQGAGALLSDADVAMYCAKRTGRGRWVVFEPHMHEEVDNQLSLRTDLGNALANDELWVAYQPVVSIDTGRVCGLEALLRWQHPDRGLVSPADFIPIAEESDAIVALGAFVLDQGLTDLARWRREIPDLHLAVNVSCRQLADLQFAATVRDALQRHAVPPGALVLEVTESVLMSDPERARAGLDELRGLGVRVAIDDFGTGYSALSYLRQFPVDQVKIDRSFISGLRRGGGSEVALLRSIVDLCRSLELQTVGEGIETAEELAVLAELGCDLGQGYLLAPPRPASDHPYRLLEVARSA